MPNLIGKQPEEAVQELAELGLTNVLREEDRGADEDDENKVTEQSIDPGDPVSIGDQITITFGNPPGGVNG
jgi:beta-lactam-binding protein with PASTA domain